MGFFERMKKYNYNDVIEIYASCGHMCYTFSYNFDLNKSGDKWLFSCNCSVSDKEERVKSDNREITQEEAENVIKAAEESDLADKIKKHRPRPLSRVVFVCDETMYSSSLKFADGTNLNANCKVSENVKDLFYALAEKYDMPILYSCHPRSKKRLDAMGFQLDERVKLHEPLGFHDYNHLQMNAFAVVSDSGTLPEESSFFTSVGHPFPAVCIRTSTERPEALDKGCFVLAGISEGGVEQAVATAVAMNANGDNGIPVPYYTEDVSTKVVKIIQSYTGVVNKMVWRKN